MSVLFYTISGWLFGLLLFAIGVINTCWGNDSGLGVGLLLLSFVYYPPINVWLKKRTGFSIPVVAKVILGALLLWITLGVGELFAKIELMRNDL